MTEDDIRLAAEALGVIPRSKTRPKSLEVPPGGLSQAQRQTQQTLSEGIKSAAERREAEESEAWGQEVAEKTTPLQKVVGGLEATAALPSAAVTGILGHLGEGFKLLPPGGANQFVAENFRMPRGEAGQHYFDVMAGGVDKAADWFGETPLGEFLGDAFEKLPGIFPIGGAATKAVDEGIMGAGKGLKLAAEQARKQRQYETGQEGAFYRVRPVTEETGRAPRGNKEEAGGGAETPGGPVRGDVPQPITDDALTEVMAQPDNFVRSVASDYAQQVNGRPYELPEMAPSSLLKQAPIGRAFDLAVSDDPKYKKSVFEAYGNQMPEVIEQSGAKNYDQLVEAAYRQLAKETDDQFRRLPVNMSYHRAGEGNYSDSRDMLRDVYGNRHLYVFQGGDPHPFMSRVDPETGLNDNEKFRAVHDFFGHAIHGNQFGPKGEETAWLAHSQMYSPLARLAMSTETRGQNSVVNYTPLNAKLKAKLSEIEGRIYEARRRGQTDDLKELQDIKKGLFEQFQFAPQYGLLLPPEMIRPDFAGKMPDYVRPLIQPRPGTATGARLFHYGKEPGIKVTDPSRYGTGIKGAEASRLEGAEDIRPRTYFYTDPTKPPEAGLGPYRYTGEADLYDLEEDPLAFRTLAAESLRSPFTAKVNPGMVDPGDAITAAERLVKEYGYPGYMTPESGTAAVFQPVPVQQYSEGGAVNPFEVPTPENLALDPILAEEREMRRLKRAQEMAQRPLAEKAKGALEAAQTTASTVGRGVLRPFAELAGQAFGEKGMGERLVQSAPQPQTEVGKHYTGEVQDVMQEVGKFLEPAKIPQGPYMPELIPSLPYAKLIPSLPYANRPQMLTQKLEEEFATPPIGAVQLQTQQAQRNPLGMYSQAEQVALNLPQQKGTGNQFLAQISKAPGVKPAELEWTGLADFLKSKGDKPVTKQEIQQHLDANRVQVKEVELGDTLEARELDRWLDNWADKNPDTKTSDAIMRGLSFDEIAQVAKSENQPVVARLIGNQNNPAQYSQWQLPGGSSNYREVLLTLPTESLSKDYASVVKDYAKEFNISERIAALELRAHLKDPSDTPVDERYARRLRDAAEKSQFKSSHFDQPNILAHMRLNDRVDANGDKVLFVEEMQSDWGQQGREKGFESRENLATKNAKLADLKTQFDKSIERFEKAKARYNNRTPSDNDLDLFMDMRNANNEADFLRQEMDKINKGGLPPAPFVQNTEDWVNLSLKRLITDAVNNGYKKVAFINGDQSADRYDLSKQVKEVRHSLNKDGTYDLFFAPVGDGRGITKRNASKTEVEDLVGKELAQKIIAGEGRQMPDAYKSLTSVDLKVGGEGMKKFYDQIVPATANKLLKKLGGGKLEPMQIGDNQQLGFTITPEMVELVKKQGLPMFAAGGAVTMAKGGKVAKGMSGISAAREAMKAQRREERVQKNLEAYMGSTEKPQTYYHATQAPKDFRKFDLEKRPTPKSAAAVFLTPSTDWANEFDMADLKTLESATSAAPRIMPMITRAKNTFDYENPEHVEAVMKTAKFPKRSNPFGPTPAPLPLDHIQEQISLGNWNFIEDQNVQKAIKDLGFDSFNVKEKGVKNMGVFNPADVKALFNRGSYDPTTEDISKAAGGPVLKGIAKARAEAKMSTGGKAVKGADSALSGIAAARAAQKAQRASKLEEALEAKQPPMTTPQGTGLPLMPRDQGMYIPGVKQEDLPRMTKVDKARASGKRPEYTERMEDLLQSRAAKKKVDTLIEKGDALGMREWYGIEPLRQVAMDIGMSPEKFNEFIAQMASASQRNPVDQQNRMGSYLWHLSQTGGLPSNAFLYTNKMRRGKQGLPEGSPIELPSGYGSLAQGDIFNRGLQIARGDIEGALPPDKKLGTFYRNYLGNLRPVTVDVNAVRGPIIERGDPRWLASKLVEKDEEGNVTGTYFPRKAVQSGLMSIKQAKERPGFWEAAPSGSEYAGFEDLWQSAAKRFGIQPAEAQALGWYGSADVTALKTKPELYVDNLERMIRRTAEQTGKNPRQVMEDMLRGTEYLRKKGGLVRS